MLFFKINLFLNFNQTFLFFTNFTNLESYNRIFCNVFYYVQTVSDNIESNKQYELIFTSLISGIYCITYIILIFFLY